MLVKECVDVNYWWCLMIIVVRLLLKLIRLSSVCLIWVVLWLISGNRVILGLILLKLVVVGILLVFR